MREYTNIRAAFLLRFLSAQKMKVHLHILRLGAVVQKKEKEKSMDENARSKTRTSR